MKKLIFISLLAVFVLVPFLADGQTTVYIRRKGEAPTPTPTPSPTPTPGLTWTNTTNVTADGSSISKNNPDAYAYANTEQTIENGAGTPYFEFDLNSGTVFAVIVALGLESGGPYNAPPAGAVSLTFSPGDYVEVTLNGSYSADFTATPTDIIRIGFDGSNHVRIWKNGTPVYTSSGTYAAGDYILIVEFGWDAGAGSGLENMSVNP